MVFQNRRPPVRGRLLNERGQGLSILLAGLAGLLWLAAKAKGLV